MLRRPKRQLFIIERDEDESEEDESDLKRPKTIKYSKILEEENDFWPEENFRNQ